MLQTKVRERYSDRMAVMTHERELFEQEAKLALDMVTRWGMLASVEDGEDSSGRQKGRLLTPDELTNRAFETAKLFMDKARNKGLIHTLPDITELDKDTKV